MLSVSRNFNCDVFEGVNVNVFYSAFCIVFMHHGIEYSSVVMAVFICGHIVTGDILPESS